MNSSLLFSTSFLGATQMHGGARRTRQLKELVEGAGYGLEPACQGRRFGALARYSQVARMAWRERLPFYPSRYALGTAGELALDYGLSFREHQGVRVLLWEDTTRYFVPYLARRAGYRVLALPQNLESLVEGQRCPFSRRDREGRWRLERAGLAQADAVFCISREEQWLLNVWGVRADYLGYFPPSQIEEELRRVRALRQDRVPENRFLLLGTVLNPPTRQGMLELLQWLRQLRNELSFQLDIAGYGTESLADQVDHPDFLMHGAISDAQVYELLSSTRGLIAFQRNGLGVLTRIPEMLLAGVPILANAHAARSYLGVPGVHSFERPNELLSLLQRPPELPPAPSGAPGQAAFVEHLAGLAGFSRPLP